MYFFLVNAIESFLAMKITSFFVVSASGSETTVSSSTPASATIYDAYTSIIKKKIENYIFLCQPFSLYNQLADPAAAAAVPLGEDESLNLSLR